MATKINVKKELAALEAVVYKATDGKKAGTVMLPGEVFGLPWNADLVHQVVTGMQANARQPWAHAKDRGEVRGGGKKPWKQKGTGRARHGSSRSPIWRHGGVTHGPRKDRDFGQKLNKKMRRKALFTALAKKHSDGQTLFLSGLSLKEPKTKDARTMLSGWGGISGYEALMSRRSKAAYIVLPKEDANVKKSFRNMGNVLVGTVANMNPVDLLSYRYVVLAEPEESVKLLAAKAKTK